MCFVFIKGKPKFNSAILAKLLGVTYPVLRSQVEHSPNKDVL
jgi:hypothetical protein